MIYPINMKLNKKGAITSSTVESYAKSIVFIIVLLLMLAQLIPEGQTAGASLNETGVPLGSLFTSTGVIWLILMAGVVFLFISSFMGKGK